ncbi:unnamed protein product [Lymnaea stagnalis]|uniref:Apextrin C-terminal domain-containing protein n=1 Tax=Lymnaea stagnalis TaxID=6523 RepID=A0AAV2HRS3_LYMST
MSSTYFATLLSLVGALMTVGQCSFLLTTSPLKSGPDLASNVTFGCRYWGDESTSAVSKVLKMSILRRTSPKDDPVAVGALSNNQTVITLNDPTAPNVTCYLGTLVDSYLSITWRAVTLEVFGQFVCEVQGVGASGGGVTERSPEVKISEPNLTSSDVIELIIRDRVDRNSLMADIEKNYIEKIKVLEDKVANFTNDVARFAVEENDLKANLDTLAEHPMLQYWPEGTYALLAPQSGCPFNVAAEWTTGYKKFHTESDLANHNNASWGAHFMAPFLAKNYSGNFLYQHFCVLTDSPGPAWPQGSYCINRKGGNCTAGFHSGAIRYDEEDLNGAGRSAGDLPDGTYSTSMTTLHYCCRSDGLPETKVVLPKGRPFYLYRYNGTCQEVEGMTVEAEEMVVDTESSYNKDLYENDYHPDGQINDVVLQLCYYVKL